MIANTEAADETAPSGAVSSWSAVFVYTFLTSKSVQHFRKFIVLLIFANHFIYFYFFMLDKGMLSFCILLLTF